MKKCIGTIWHLLTLIFILHNSVAYASSNLKITFGRDASPKLDIIEFSNLPSITVPKATGPVKLGSRFNENGWKQALHLKDFSRTRFHAMQIARGLSGGGDATTFLKQASKPRQQTEVFLLYDDQSLYVGFQCRDDDMKNLIVEGSGKRRINIVRWLNSLSPPRAAAAAETIDSHLPGILETLPDTLETPLQPDATRNS